MIKELRFTSKTLKRLGKFDKKNNVHKQKFPEVIQIQTTNKCNGSCIMCPYPYLNKNTPRKVMDNALFTKIVKELKESKDTKEIFLTLQNEPLLDKKIVQRVKEMKNSVKNKAVVSIITNGSLLKKKAAALKKAGIDRIYVSIDASNEKTYEKIRNNKNYNRIISDIDSIMEKEDHPKIIVRFSKQKINSGEEKEFRELWKEKNVKIEIFNINNRAGQLERYQDINNLGINQYKHWLKKELLKTCPLPFYSMSILYDGRVLMCCHDWKAESSIGNLEKNSIREVWNNKKINNFRSLLYQRKKGDMPLCKGCVLG